MTPTYTQVGTIRFGYRSCVFLADNFPLLGIVGLTTKQKRARKNVKSGVPGARPLGRTTGLYSIPTLSVKMLREDSETFAQYLAQKNVGNGQDPGEYANVTFNFSAQCIETTNTAATVTMLASQCVVVDKSSDYDMAIGALVDEYTIEALQVAESDQRGQRFMYSSSPNVLDALAQDFVTIGGDISPGRATILDLKREIGWDIRQGYAYSLATLIPKGNPPATFSIRFDLWDESQLTPWTLFSAKWLKRALVTIPGSINADGSSKNYAISVQHPILQAQPIALQNCVVSKIHGLNTDDEELVGCTIDFLEYGKPIVALQKGPTQVPPASKTQPTATSQLQTDIQTAQNQFNNLANGTANQLTSGGGS